MFLKRSREMWRCVDSGCGDSRTVPCARGKHSATLLGGHVYVLGGRGAGGAVPLKDFWRFSLATGEWERLESRGDVPPSLQEHTATAHENKLYVFGGEAGSSSHETPLWIYDTELQVWRKVPGNPRPAHARRSGSAGERGEVSPSGRRGHSAHSLRDCLLLYGGYMDLRGSTNELWAFHYESESWRLVRGARAGPARHRHAAALLAARLYVHGGQCDLRDCADLWHYDIATETWERINQSIKWPSARVDGRVLLVGGEGGVRPALQVPARPRPEPPTGFLREISKLSSFHRRRGARCSYTVLAGEQDSTESLVRSEQPSLSKSRSAYVIDERQPADGGESPVEGDEAERYRSMSREPISVPDFADMVLPTPVLSQTEATKLVYLDTEEEEEMKREISQNGHKKDLKDETPKVKIVALPKSASVRFMKEPVTDITEDEAELSTSDYASAEKVNRLSGASSLGFSNPHYLGPDVRNLGIAMTPDSGVGPGDIELQDLGERRARSEPRNGETQLYLLLVGGKEPPHLALLQSPLSMWTYRLL
ncbi:unnamed protein product [Parnassius apollo]|uniref:(apollo) hypothetical protein n=1 Tax=Parnassius apollo TaxID=110799 RepID=A0A8S3XWQ1_PARAO|nr:unnamed protein product [Parnassius apollo]